MCAKILVTGGAGYIGSHTCIELLNVGHEISILDNLCNSKPECVERIQEIAGKNLRFVAGDIRERDLLDALLDKTDAVIHFAGLKSAPESVGIPLDYYDNNIIGTVTLLQAMQDAGCKKMVFSSSATVYGSENSSPLREDMPEGVTTNPYGTTKLYIERILKDIYAADSQWSISLLRYFNPVGAHESGHIGEDPAGVPKNIAPYIAQVAIGKLPFIPVAGDDFPTPDGTGIRDYIHVVDLARGHVAALDRVLRGSGLDTYNLGTGKGISVLEMIRAFEKAVGKELPRRIVQRRPGDVAQCYSDPSKAQKELGWKAQYDLERMCADAWRWQTMNSQGFGEEE